jgi:two-component system, NtrC family, nitrogen regulation sensor histidine kinase NtrY
MIHKHFRIGITVRVLIMVVLALVLAWVITHDRMLFVPVTIVLLLVGSAVNLIYYIEKSNRDLTHFLLSIRQGGFTEYFTSANRGKKYKELSDAMNEVVREFAAINMEKELHYQFLLALNENINVAILSLNADGKVIMINAAGKKMLNAPFLQHVEHFKRIDRLLYETIKKLRSNERAVIKVFLQGEQFHLSVQAKEIVLQGEFTRIILLQNISDEIEEKEIEAWHQLVRVLNHEIMNSVTPIVSLTQSMAKLLTNADGTRKDLKTLTDENLEDVFSSLSTIASRSKGLLTFANAYKEYAKPLEVHIKETNARAVVERIVGLLKPDLDQFKIKIHLITQHEFMLVRADETLLEQVLINVIKNAIEAVPHDGSGSIDIRIGTKSNGGTYVAIADNGAGMDDDTMSRIFIPFFTTKPKGTGIGLSLSRQIMKLHNGNVRVQSTVNEGSVFTLELGG